MHRSWLERNNPGYGTGTDGWNSHLVVVHSKIKLDADKYQNPSSLPPRGMSTKIDEAEPSS
jgi:hypothetical protein